MEITVLKPKTDDFEKMKLSPFWKTANFEEGERVVIRNLGEFYKGQEFKAIVRGVYACDVHGNPDHYICQLIDKIPLNPAYTNDSDDYVRSFSCHVFPRGCVYSMRDVTVKDETCLPST